MKEGTVNDLLDKLAKREITPKEITKILEERGVKYRESWKNFIGFLVWGLCMSLSLFFQLLKIEFLIVIIYLAIIILIFTICMEILNLYWRFTKGGLHSDDNTIVLIKTGPYKIVRHPSHVNGSFLFISFTIAISNFVPFTIFSIVGNIIFIASLYRNSLVEERELNLKKWGDEYREYMKEVPRFNFIKGLLNLIKKKKKSSS